jgi:hypothetical protein
MKNQGSSGLLFCANRVPEIRSSSDRIYNNLFETIIYAGILN